MYRDGNGLQLEKNWANFIPFRIGKLADTQMMVNSLVENNLLSLFHCFISISCMTKVL